jgi:hypothetical protein
MLLIRRGVGSYSFSIIVPKINIIKRIGEKLLAGTDIGIFSLNIDAENGFIDTIYDEIMNSYFINVKQDKIQLKHVRHERILGATPINLGEILLKFKDKVNVTSLLEIDNKVLIGTKGGLILMNLLTKKHKFYYPINKHITVLCKDSKNRIWIGTENGISIGYFIGDELKLVTNLTIHSKLPSSKIKTIVCHPYKDEVWIGTDRGVCKVIGELNILVVYEEKCNITDGCFTQNGDIWFSTEDTPPRLIRFNKEEKVEVFDVKEIKHINAITPIPQNKLILCGDELIEVDVNSLEVVIYRGVRSSNFMAVYYDYKTDLIITGTYFFGIFIKKGDKIFGEEMIHVHGLM